MFTFMACPLNWVASVMFITGNRGSTLVYLSPVTISIMNLAAGRSDTFILTGLESSSAHRCSSELLVNDLLRSLIHCKNNNRDWTKFSGKNETFHVIQLKIFVASTKIW